MISLARLLLLLPILTLSISLTLIAQDAESGEEEMEDDPYVSHGEYDSIDFRNVLSGVLEINLFRFDLSPPVGSEGFFPDFVFERYEDGELVESASIAELLEKTLSGSKSPELMKMYIGRIVREMVTVDSGRILRMYVRSVDPTIDRLVYGFEDQMQTSDIPIDTGRFGNGSAHAFPYEGVAVGSTIPLLAIYHVAKGDPFTPCPKDAPPAMVASMFPMVFIVSLKASEPTSLLTRLLGDDDE